MIQEIRKADKKAWLIFCLTFIILIGNVVKIGDIRVFGVVLSLYRVGIPVFTLGFLVRRLKSGQLHLEYFSKPALVIAIMMVFWIVYGGISLLINPYASVREGMKELLSLSLGLCSIYCIYESCDDHQAIEYLIISIKVIITGLLIWAIFENFTNIHFYTSKLYNPVNFEELGVPWYVGLGIPQMFAMTTIFYNINDFCSLLAVTLPLFFYNPQKSKRSNCLNLIILFMGIIVLAMDDANISLVSVLAAMIAYVILVRGYRLHNSAMIGGTLFIQLFGFRIYESVSVTIKNALVPLTKKEIDFYYKQISGKVHNLAAQTTIGDVVASQLDSATKGSGSLLNRILLYKESFVAFFKTYGLGLGPAGFQRYFENNEHESVLVNPHNWWLEILTQYGIFVFVAYLGSMLMLYIRMIKLYLRNNSCIYAQVIGMCTSFVIACIAPSSFLGYSYQWLLPALCIVMINSESR